MAKKIRYSQPLAELWDSYNKSNKSNNLSPKEFIHKWIDPQIMNPFMPDGTLTQTNILIADLFYADSIKKFLHLYFVDKSLRDFLAGLPIRDFDGLKKFIVENGTQEEDGMISTFGQVKGLGTKTAHLDFGIHIPFENRMKGYAFSFLYKPENDKLVFVWIVGQNAGFLPFEQYKVLEKEKTEDLKKLLEYFNLAVNTIVYMNTFPECVVDGVPNQVKDEYSKKITIAEKILENIENHDSKKMMTPHFRRGYFKRLTSDFYTRKKGQCVFVRETMVNGKAKTVYTADNLEKLSEE